MSVTEEKKQLRKQMKTLRAGISEADLTKHRLFLTDRFLKICSEDSNLDPTTESLCRPTALFSYLDIANEVPTRGVIEIALMKGIPVYLPKTYPDGVMVFARVTDLNDMVDSRFHIPEPQIIPEITPVVCRPEFIPVVEKCIGGRLNARSIFDDEFRTAWMLVPGLAFSEEGYRLGYGGGYYDRYVKDAVFTTIAMAYDFQILPEIPREAHDAKCDKMYILKTL
ncbi:MAG: hypothetical protein J6T47_04940 [Lachnospiraceae bacterium]|nr:hypothetical protein [Lachnospiraceae bacterium]